MNSPDSDKTQVNPASSGGPLPIERIGPYRVVKFLGEGGMGRVFLAQHAVLDRMCALKFMPEELARQAGWIERFKSEARTLARLDHPNIVRLHGAVADTKDSKYYLEMEFVDGGDLEERVKKARPGLDETLTRKILDETFQALSYAHGMNVVHRDLKPANLLLRKDGTVKISDFGLATVVGEDYHRSLIQKSITLSQLPMTETMRAETPSVLSAVGGTLPYMSPQSKQGEAPDPRDDIYAVGVMTYYLLTTRMPEIDTAPLRKLRPELTRGWDEFFRRCIASRREDRFQNAEEARTALLAIGQRRGRRGLWLGLAAVLAIGGAGAAWFYVQQTSTTPLIAPRAAQAITFTAPAQQLTTDTPHPLAATANSGLPVSYQLLSGPARIEEGRLIFTGPGRVVVRASQPGDTRFSAAPPVEAVFEIADRPPVQQVQRIDFVALANLKTDAAPFPLVASATSGLPVGLEVVSGPAVLASGELRVTGPGTVTVRATQPGNPFFAAAPAIEHSFQVEKAVPAEIIVSLPGDLTMRFVLVPAGTNRLGPAPGERGAMPTDAAAQDFHTSTPVYLLESEVTQAQYIAVTGIQSARNPSYNRSPGGLHPVEQIKFTDLMRREGAAWREREDGFFGRLNQRLGELGLTDFVAVLPSEAEWEYACRAGSTTPFHDGSTLPGTSGPIPERLPSLGAIAVYGANTTAPVKSKTPNAWGLHDMHGNVAEWTREGHLRGGSFRDNAAACRSAARLRDQASKTSPDPRFGFRVLLKPAIE